MVSANIAGTILLSFFQSHTQYHFLATPFVCSPLPEQINHVLSSHYSFEWNTINVK